MTQAGMTEMHATAAGKSSNDSVWRRFWRMVGMRFSSSLSRRIVALNLAGLVAMLAGFLSYNQFRPGLIDARVQSLVTQGQIIAGAIAASATIEPGSIISDPEKLLQMHLNEAARPSEELSGDLEFSINPERVAPVIRRLITPTLTRARVYDRDGIIVVDSSLMFGRGDVLKPNEPKSVTDEPTLFERNWNQLKRKFGRLGLSIGDDPSPVDGKMLPEVQRAGWGQPAKLAFQLVPTGQRRAHHAKRQHGHFGCGADSAVPDGARGFAAVDA
jgi:two-component system, OmpR family, sensor histidine kinase ChvG